MLIELIRETQNSHATAEIRTCAIVMRTTPSRRYGQTNSLTVKTLMFLLNANLFLESIYVNLLKFCLPY